MDPNAYMIAWTIQATNAINAIIEHLGRGDPLATIPQHIKNESRRLADSAKESREKGMWN